MGEERFVPVRCFHRAAHKNKNYEKLYSKKKKSLLIFSIMRFIVVRSEISSYVEVVITVLPGTEVNVRSRPRMTDHQKKIAYFYMDSYS
jgi:hypothetical protein